MTANKTTRKSVNFPPTVIRSTNTKQDSDSHFCQSFAGIRRGGHAAQWMGITFCYWPVGRMTPLCRETNSCFRRPCGPRQDAQNVKEQEQTPSIREASDQRLRKNPARSARSSPAPTPRLPVSWLESDLPADRIKRPLSLAVVLQLFPDLLQTVFPVLADPVARDDSPV